MPYRNKILVDILAKLISDLDINQNQFIDYLNEDEIRIIKEGQAKLGIHNVKIDDLKERLSNMNPNDLNDFAEECRRFRNEVISILHNRLNQTLKGKK